MKGDGAVRHCERCALNVFNLSEMNQAEASELVAKSEGNICVRFYRRADGTMLTKDCPVGLAARTGRRMRALAAGLFALLGFLPSCSADAEARVDLEEHQTESTDDPGTPTGLERIEAEPKVTMGRMRVEDSGRYLVGLIVLDPPESQTEDDR